MKQQGIIALLLTLSSVVQAELVSDKNNNTVSETSLEILLETAPVNAQKKLLNNKKQLTEQLEQLYLREVLAKMALQEGLDKQGINAERLQTVMNNALYLLKLDALQKSNTRDYSKYAKQIYLANQSEYQTAARIDAAHILVSTKNISDADALQKASSIRQQLMQGANFADLAVKESDDKTAQSNQGELGLFTLDKMVKPFSAAAYAMQPGDISQPVKTQYGYHIIKLNQKMPEGVKPFAEVKDVIIAKLKQKDWEVDRAEFYEQVKKENVMQIDELAVDEFVIKKLDELNKPVKK